MEKLWQLLAILAFVVCSFVVPIDKHHVSAVESSRHTSHHQSVATHKVIYTLDTTWSPRCCLSHPLFSHSLFVASAPLHPTNFRVGKTSLALLDTFFPFIFSFTNNTRFFTTKYPSCPHHGNIIQPMHHASCCQIEPVIKDTQISNSAEF